MKTLLRSLFAVLVLSSPALAEETVLPKTLTLEEALRIATQNQPQLRQSRSSVEAANARADAARAPLLPQVSANVGYSRSTSNFAPRPGSVPSSINQSGNLSFASSNFFTTGVSAQQLIWDWDTRSRWHAAEANAEAQVSSQQATGNTVNLNVRTQFFAAQAQRALVGVAKSTLENVQKHLEQIQGFVEVGTRPQIDLAQARADRANAQVQLINAENAYETAKARLNQAMGLEGAPEYDVADERLQPVPEEDRPLKDLADLAVQSRPDLAAFEASIRSATLSVKAARGGYFPSFGAGFSISDNGTSPANLVPNASFQLTMAWPLYQGGLVGAQVREAEANLASLRAQRDDQRQRVFFEVDQARLAVRAAKATLDSAAEALASAKERLTLAEGRYQSGVGNSIELADAQLQVTNSAAQRVQAEFTLSSARAQLTQALGRP